MLVSDNGGNIAVGLYPGNAAGEWLNANGELITSKLHWETEPTTYYDIAVYCVGMNIETGLLSVFTCDSIDFVLCDLSENCPIDLENVSLKVEQFKACRKSFSSYAERVKRVHKP